MPWDGPHTPPGEFASPSVQSDVDEYIGIHSIWATFHCTLLSPGGGRGFGVGGLSGAWVGGVWELVKNLMETETRVKGERFIEVIEVKVVK